MENVHLLSNAEASPLTEQFKRLPRDNFAIGVLWKRLNTDMHVKEITL